ncbi:MAG: heavy-metal-associated domain-containing protein [Ignavibacteriales bacterium]|nr:heavy-metal-associated domain-containing protein [Ignavibacteriales bacterium]
MLIVFSVFFFAVSASAQEPESKSVQVKGKETVTIAVESMQCGTCKKAVEKALKKVDGVEAVRVDLEAGKATVTYTPALTTFSSLETAITKAGYTANDKKADPEAYEKLDDCCKLPED